VTTSQNLKKRGLFAPYDSPERKVFREGYKDPQADWTSTYTNYGAFGYNMRTVAKTSVPTSFNDLLKPEWKGQITMEGRAYEWFGTTLKTMGEENPWLICVSWPSRRSCAPGEICSLSWSLPGSLKERSAAIRKRLKS
jgi:ABC-type Fe3+ transport system substrate-binding protein